jgi:type I restriction enzyme S subunit
MIKIGDKVDISNGYAFKSSKYVEQGIRVVRITNVQKGEIQDDNPKFYSSDTKEELKSYLINEGDILMSLTGNVGRVGVFPKEFCPAYLNQRVARIRVKSQDLFQKYLFYMLNSKFFERDAIFNSSGIAQLNLSTKWVSEYKIPLPKLDQQKKIAAILDAADTCRQKTKVLITKYDELTQSLFLDMFGDPVTNPKGWNKVELMTLCDKITDGTHKTPKYQDSGVVFLSAKNIKNFQLNYLDCKYISEIEHIALSKRCPVEIGDLLLTKSGSLGMAAMVEFDFEFSIFESLALVKYNRDLINGKFLLFYLNTPSTQFQYHAMTKGVGVKHLHLTDLRKLSVIVPPKDLQEEFMGKIKAIEAQKAQAQASLAQAEDLFNSLLQRAFKGDLV